MGNRNVLITGASTGIGKACALRFADLGYRVFAGVRNPADAAVLRAHASGTVEPVFLDVTSAESIAAAVATAGGEALAGLVNNAGIAVAGPLELVPVEAWRRQFEVNVIGPVAVTRACLPALRRGRGRIVFVGSVAGRSALPGSGAYDASKFALEGIADALRMELQPSGVSVSLIEAGAVATPIWDKSLREVEELVRRAGPDRCAPYRGLLTNLRDEVAKSARNALPADAVVPAVVHAMTARRPKTRYVVGRDARFWLLLNWLPDRWRDRLVLSGIRE